MAYLLNLDWELNPFQRYTETYNCYLEGLSLEKIAEIRKFTVSTIVQHLSKLQGQGKEIDWDRFVDKEKEPLILESIKKVGVKGLKAIKDDLPDDFGYADIKLVIVKNRQ